MKSKNKLLCGLTAFWPFILLVLIGNIWGIYSWAAPEYEVIHGTLVARHSHGVLFLGKFITIITGVILAVVALAWGWIWCEGNYRECIGLPRERNKEEEK